MTFEDPIKRIRRGIRKFRASLDTNVYATDPVEIMIYEKLAERQLEQGDIVKVGGIKVVVGPNPWKDQNEDA